MIDKKELRCGNLLKHGDVIVTVEEIGDDGINICWMHELTCWDYDYKNLEPIPLTPEWLIRCGLKDLAGNGMAYRMDINLADEVCWYMQDGFLRYQSIGNGFTRCREHIKHVHELQNFIYWHTGKELEIKNN